MGKTIQLLIGIVLLSSCSHFSKMAVYNKVENIDGETRIYNEKLNLSNLNYGDVKFAFSKKEFKKLTSNKKPAFKNVILYGQTYIEPFYNYYLLQGEDCISNADYTIFEYNFQESKFNLAISKGAPEPDVEFIKSHISAYLK